MLNQYYNIVHILLFVQISCLIIWIAGRILFIAHVGPLGDLDVPFEGNDSFDPMTLKYSCPAHNCELGGSSHIACIKFHFGFKNGFNFSK